MPEFDAEAIGVARGAPATSSTARRWRCRSSSSDFGRAELGDLDWDTDADPAELGRLNDLAYGLEPRPASAAALATRRRTMRAVSGARATAASSPACSATMDHERRPRLLLRRHPPRPPRARPRQPADDRRAARRARARPARPPRCRARRWAGRSTSGSATPTTSRSRMYERRRRDATPTPSSRRRSRRSREPGRFDEAEALVSRAAPQLQRILAQALEAGGWFAESHEAELRKALAHRGPRGARPRRPRRCSPRRRGWG